MICVPYSFWCLHSYKKTWQSNSRLFRYYSLQLFKLKSDFALNPQSIILWHITKEFLWSLLDLFFFMLINKTASHPACRGLSACTGSSCLIKHTLHLNVIVITCLFNRHVWTDLWLGCACIKGTPVASCLLTQESVRCILWIWIVDKLRCAFCGSIKYAKICKLTNKPSDLPLWLPVMQPQNASI